MKRILSIAISMLLISNIFGVALLADAAEETCYQDAAVGLNPPVTNDFDIGLDAENGSLWGATEVALLSQRFEKRRYETDEQITVRMELMASLTGIDTTYESYGFTVTGEVSNTVDADTGCEIFNLVLAYDGVTEEPYFMFGVVTEEGLTVYAEVFGYLSEYGLFISESSYDAAEEASYYYNVELGLWTMEEYNERLQQEYSKEGTESIDHTLSVEPMSGSEISPLAVIISPAYTTVSGNLGWIDDDGVWHPMQYNRVEVWDSLKSVKLGTVYTDDDGHYSFTFFQKDASCNIYVKIYPGGENSIVKTGYGAYYVYPSGTSLVAPGSGVSIDWEIDMTSDLGRAFQISQAINVATKYVKQMNGEYIAPVTVKYPHIEDISSCFYSSVEDTLYIRSCSPLSGCPESYASWDVLMHEYGHHVQAEFGISSNPGGVHGFEDNLAVTNSSKDIGIRLAWGEAYASVFGGMAQAYYASTLQNIATVGDAAYISYNSASLNYETTTKRIGEACEASIIGVLWDLFDTATESHDNISFSHSTYWDMITNCDSESLSDFCNYFNENYSMSKRLALGKLLSYYKMSASNLTVRTVGATQTFAWTANGTSTSLQNNRFDIVILDGNKNEILCIEDITATSYKLSTAEFNTVLNSAGTTYYVVVIAYQTSSPATGGYYSEALSVTKTHTHLYGNYVYNNSSTHIRNCLCGAAETEAHYVRESDIVDGRYATCLGCNTLLDLTEDIAQVTSSTISHITLNGSYVLPNGIVVLADEDVEAYMNGTLQFYNSNDVPSVE